MGQLVFVPLSREAAQALRRTGQAAGELIGAAATPALLAAHEYDAATLEDAEFAALSYAGVLALTAPGQADPLRLVVVADVAPSHVQIDPADPYGAVVVRDLRWSEVQALFGDEPAAAAPLRPAVAVARGLSVAEAMARPEVAEVVDELDLLWFAPEELDQLPSSPTS